MARYIDTDILAKIVFDKWQECEELKHIIPAIRNAVMCASTDDVAEVVRCKDCKYFDQAEKYCCDFLTAEEDGFCKWGERRRKMMNIEWTNADAISCERTTRTRYIDADNAISVFKILADKCADDKAFEQSISVLKDVPTADVVERKDLDKITEEHEKIGYEEGYRDGYAQAVEDASDWIEYLGRVTTTNRTDGD